LGLDIVARARHGAWLSFDAPHQCGPKVDLASTARRIALDGNFSDPLLEAERAGWNLD